MRCRAHDGSVHERAGFGRKSAAQRQGLGRAGFGRRARARSRANRHRARWEVAGVEQPTELLERVRFAEALPILRRPTEGEDIAADYRHVGVSLGRHPLTLLRHEARGGRNQDGSCRRGVGAGRARPLGRARHHSATAVERVGGYLRNPRGRDGLLESRGLGAARAARPAGVARCDVARRIWGRAEGERGITRDCRAAFRSQRALG